MSQTANPWLALRRRHWKPDKPQYRLACGHESSPENTIWRGKKWRTCRRCEAIFKILAALAERAA